MYKVLVTSKSFAKYNPEVIGELREKGIQLVRASKSNMTDEEIAKEIVDYDGLVCGIDPINEKVISAGKRLRIIHMNGTGVDHIDIKAATRHHVYVGNCPGANAVAVAELNLGILLAEARKIVKHSNLIEEGKWERETGVELTGKTMGILGIGAIGKHFVELLKGFHMKVLAYDVKPDVEWCRENNVKLVRDTKEIFKTCDFISLNLPLVESTKYVINRESLRLMKKDAIIVNTARGGLIETDNLVEALKNHEIRGAALDAFEQEPLPDNDSLRTLDITLTPHIGASSVETMKNVTCIIARHLEEVLLQGNVTNMINS